MNPVNEIIFIPEIKRFCDCVDENCHCGERNEHEWAWDDKLASTILELSNNNLEVRFHPGYSSGTAAMRGNKPMEHGRHHYWEIKMLTAIYGTDVMVGVGTEKTVLNNTRDIFCSLLGQDRESWGLSYKGYIQHNGEIKDYAPCFGQGSLIGAHLDTWRGTLQFYINRKPLGIAFTGLKDMNLYPMVSSTAAKSRMRITCSSSIPVSLQSDCLALLCPLQRSYLSAAFPGLQYLTKSIMANILQKENCDDTDEDYVWPPEVIMDDFDYALLGTKKKCKKKN